MSFILDALRKSEAERQRQDAPGYISVQSGVPTQSSKKWIWLGAAILLLNIAVLAGVFLRVDFIPAPESTSAETTASDSVIIPAPAATAADIQPVRAQTSLRPQAVSNDVPITPQLTEAFTATDPAVETTFALPETGSHASSISESFPTFNNLRVDGVLNLPDMHLDIHVYSGESADRFVFINMRKYKENAALSEGPVVQEITPEGVILEFRGTRFLLPRQ